MYLPPPKEVLQKLKGKEVDTVSHAKYVMHISFDKDNMITVEAPFQLRNDCEKESRTYLDFPLSNSPAVRILGSRVFDIDTSENGSLILSFENGEILIVDASEHRYEAYTLKIDGRKYVV